MHSPVSPSVSCDSWFHSVRGGGPCKDSSSVSGHSVTVELV